MRRKKKARVAETRKSLFAICYLCVCFFACFGLSEEGSGVLVGIYRRERCSACRSRVTLHECVCLFVKKIESIKVFVAIRCWKLKCGGVTSLRVYMQCNLACMMCSSYSDISNIFKTEFPCKHLFNSSRAI